MNIIKWMKGVFKKMFKSEAQREFNIKINMSGAMDREIIRWANIYRGIPEWIEPGIRTINFAKAVAGETARLTTLALGISVEGSARAELLQKQTNMLLKNLRTYVEYGCAYGGVMLKPNGAGVDCFTPPDFMITDVDSNGEVTGVVFFDHLQRNDDFYTRLEYHRFIEQDKKLYAVSNRAYKSRSKDDIGRKTDLKKISEWSMLEEETYMENIEHPLFGYLRMPAANNIDEHSPMGMAIFADAIEELKDLDIAYSRNGSEIYDSDKLVLIDSTLLMEAGKKIGTGTNIKLPKYVKQVMGTGINEVYHEIVPELNTDIRKTGIDNLLSLIGYKCGYSNGYFVFNEKTGMATATQVESDDRRTIQLIKDIRDCTQTAVEAVIYALDKMADLYALTSAGTYKVNFDFGDITYNWEEDRARHWQYVQAGKYPITMYYMKFEGMSEEEAKQAVQMAAEENKSSMLFEEE